MRDETKDVDWMKERNEEMNIKEEQKREITTQMQSDTATPSATATQRRSTRIKSTPTSTSRTKTDWWKVQSYDANGKISNVNESPSRAKRRKREQTEACAFEEGDDVIVVDGAVEEAEADLLSSEDKDCLRNFVNRLQKKKKKVVAREAKEIPLQLPQQQKQPCTKAPKLETTIVPKVESNKTNGEANQERLRKRKMPAATSVPEGGKGSKEKRNIRHTYMPRDSKNDYWIRSKTSPLARLTQAQMSEFIVNRGVLFDENLITADEREQLMAALPEVDREKFRNMNDQQLDPLANIQIKSAVEHYLELLRDGNLERTSRPKWERTVKSLNASTFGLNGNNEEATTSTAMKTPTDDAVIVDTKCRDADKGKSKQGSVLWFQTGLAQMEQEAKEANEAAGGAAQANGSSAANRQPGDVPALALPDAIMAIKGLY